MSNYREHILNKNIPVLEALRILDELPDNMSRTLFVVDDMQKMVGSLTDGDIRRGLLNGNLTSGTIELFMNVNFKSLHEKDDNVEIIKKYKKSGINRIPLIDERFQIIEILDLNKIKTLLPLTALIMAGGRGDRLRPLTDVSPKPMLKVGEKPILEHNIDRLISFGISDIYISVKYMKEQIMDYFGDGENKKIKITYVEEDVPLGTLGALSLINKLEHNDVLVMNSDLLTNIDFEDFFNFYKAEGASMALASIPYVVNIPYAVIQTENHTVQSFSEKPSYTYYSNGGIYLMDGKLKELLSWGEFFNATDLMDLVIADRELSLVHYPLLGYWLDIGKHQDYIKAQEDIKHITF